VNTLLRVYVDAVTPVEVLYEGEMSRAKIEKLIKFLEMTRDVYPEELCVTMGPLTTRPSPSLEDDSE
jgi:hypothetical protein